MNYSIGGAHAIEDGRCQKMFKKFCVGLLVGRDGRLTPLFSRRQIRIHIRTARPNFPGNESIINLQYNSTRNLVSQPITSASPARCLVCLVRGPVRNHLEEPQGSDHVHLIHREQDALNASE